MNSFCIAEKNSEKHHAGSKARNDASSILARNGCQPLYVHYSDEKGVVDKLFKCLLTCTDWYAVCRKVKKNDTLLIQYPLAMYPKVSELAIPFLRLMKKKNVRLILLIHDLDSLRGLKFRSETLFLEAADEVIVHNLKMKEYLLQRGYRFRKIYTLGIFDYLVPGEGSTAEKNRGEIAIAGNLRSEKSGFIKYLEDLPGKLSYHLYGPYFESEKAYRNVFYMGDFQPDRLPAVMKEGWGLVWDGSSVETCDGMYGEYLKYNNPHKLSLYLACGMPVIVWSQSALAGWVTENRVGIAVESLYELSGRMSRVGDPEYENMRMRAEKIGQDIRKGKMLTKVAGDILHGQA